jgi:hypothetical protein
MTVMHIPATQVTADPALVEGFRAHYADAFQVTAAGTHSARDWAERSLRGADAMGGLFARVVWHAILGLRLTPRDTPGTLVGWQIGDDLPDRFVLDSTGGRMTGRMVFETSGASITWTTMVRFGNPAARGVWAVAAHAHRALAPRSLDAAAGSLTRHSQH